MKYIVLVSHGEFAQGVHSVLNMMLGSGREDIMSISLKNGMSAPVFVDQFKNKIGHITLEDNIILLGDIQGGSPLTNAVNSISEMGLLERTHVFAGINIPFAMNTVIMKDNCSDDELIDMLIREAKDSIVYINYDTEDTEEDI